MTCCTFVYSVINLTWFKQDVFLKWATFSNCHFEWRNLIGNESDGICDFGKEDFDIFCLPHLSLLAFWCHNIWQNDTTKNVSSCLNANIYGGAVPRRSSTSSKRQLVEAATRRSSNLSTIYKLVSIVDEMPCVTSSTIEMSLFIVDELPLRRVAASTSCRFDELPLRRVAASTSCPPVLIIRRGAHQQGTASTSCHSTLYHLPHLLLLRDVWWSKF